MTDQKYTKDDYQKAIEFALNYPPQVAAWHYDIHKDIYKVQVLDDGWYDIKLNGSFVRSCLTYKGKKQWVPDNKMTGDDYAELFK